VALQLIVFLSRLKPALTRFAQKGGHGADQFDESLQAVMALKECPEATPECWRAAALHFQLGYPNPETDPRFQAWLTARSYKKISPKAKRRRIMEKLQHAFIGILGGHKLR